MSDSKKEEVLVVTNKLASSLPVVAFKSLVLKELFGKRVITDATTLVPHVGPFFMSRSEAEENPEFRQLIPYVVLQHEDQVFTYRRGVSGDESRLHGLLSLGIGGHINPPDMDHKINYNGYCYAMDREVREEVSFPSGRDYKDQLLGFICLNLSLVTKVHLGAVHRFILSEKVIAKESDIADPKWMTKEELRENYDEMEDWSKFVLDTFLI